MGDAIFSELESESIEIIREVAATAAKPSCFAQGLFAAMNIANLLRVDLDTHSLRA